VEKDRRSSDTMNERRMQCTIVFLINCCTYTRAEPLERSENAHKPRNVVSVASVARGEHGERGPGDLGRLTDSSTAS